MELLGALVSERGAGEAFGVLAADAREAWYLETASGHHWLAQRVPHGSFFVSANQGRFQEADLDDPASTLSSPGLLRFAAEAGLWDPSCGRPLSFFAAFMRDGPHDTDYSYPRVCLLQRLWGALQPPAGACNDMTAQPTFLEPQPRKLGVRDVKAAMRNHWDGSSHDPYLHANPDEPWRPIALL
jgi:dipeptidase